MATETFKPGDAVRLKSGGPLMTVKSLQGNDVICVWFEGEMKKESEFLAATLERDDGGPVDGPSY
jgi:uncharacterized protein YodC (DUF2158 family)